MLKDAEGFGASPTLSKQAVQRDALSEFSTGSTVWRSFMNATVRRVQLSEPVLELGAGAHGEGTYHALVAHICSLRSVAVDIRLDRGPTVLANAEGALPFKEGAFSSCVSLNLLEHVPSADLVLADVRRVLTAGGLLLIGVPFLHRVHGDPSDYFRYTQHALEFMLERNGFAVRRIHACGTGPVMAALAHVDFAVPRVLRRSAFRSARRIDARLERRSRGQYRNEHDYPIGYVAIAAADG